MIRVKFTVDVPAVWNRDESDELTLWAHVELEKQTAVINGANLKSSRPSAPPEGVSLSEDDMKVAGYDVEGYKRLAVQEAHQSDEACALCARRQALLVGTYCKPCTLSDGELPPERARALAALLVEELHRLGAPSDLKRAAEALFSDAAAREMRAPQEAAAAE